MYIAIKRLTPLAVLIAGYFSGKGRPTSQVLAVIWGFMHSVHLIKIVLYIRELETVKFIGWTKLQQGGFSENKLWNLERGTNYW